MVGTAGGPLASGGRRERKGTAVKFSYDDLQWFEEDHTRRELIDGELYVDGEPADWEQRTVACLVRVLGPHAQATGGKLFTHPLEIALDEERVAVPQVLFVRDAAVIDEVYPDVHPDLAAEVLTEAGPDFVAKLAAYERRGVPEVWLVTSSEQRIEAYVLRDARYGDPVVFRSGDTVTATAVPGFSAPFDRLVPPA